MSTSNFDRKYKEYLIQFEEALTKFCDDLKTEPKILNDSLIYSLKLGGKRLRPVLMLAVADMLKVDRQSVMPFALAIELIHTYSLIHDDLPAMDNDDYRRGKLANHCVFGEGNAILAGDGLLNTAYSILLEQCFNGKEYISAAKTICDYAGIYGMIAGQSADLLHENDSKFDKKILDFIYENKTSKLFMAAILTPSILKNGKHYAELRQYACDLGILFQIVDDILDNESSLEILGKSIGKDKQEGKYSSVNIFGLDNAKLQADYLYSKCSAILEGINSDTWFLRSIVSFVRKRAN